MGCETRTTRRSGGSLKALRRCFGVQGLGVTKFRVYVIELWASVSNPSSGDALSLSYNRGLNNYQ